MSVHVLYIQVVQFTPRGKDRKKYFPLLRILSRVAVAAPALALRRPFANSVPRLRGWTRSAGQRSTFNRTTKRANNARCYIRRKRAELYNEYIDVGQRSPGRTSRASAWNKDGTEGWIATDCSKMAAPSDREWDCHVGDRNIGSLPNKLNRTTICMYNVARTPPVPLMTRSYINRSPLDASIKIKYWPAFWIKYASLLSRSSTRKLRNIGRNLIKHWN